MISIDRNNSSGGEGNLRKWRQMPLRRLCERPSSVRQADTQGTRLIALFFVWLRLLGQLVDMADFMRDNAGLRNGKQHRQQEIDIKTL